MTFSLVARDPQTGAFGMVVSSSSPAVASRCIHLLPGFGAVASQNVTNPALGTAILSALQEGLDAEAALTREMRRESHPDYRQVSVVDSHGTTAHHSGTQSLGVNHSVSSATAVAAGNMLNSEETIESMLRGFSESDAEAFEARILDGLSAAMQAGGEAGPVRSAGLKVVEGVEWATTDLRVDDSDDPVAELRRLWEIWEPQKQAYLTRALAPSEAPGYGVPGDNR
jgi:uncharacterized Ntn-hydrolase superfamily protein